MNCDYQSFVVTLAYYVNNIILDGKKIPATYRTEGFWGNVLEQNNMFFTDQSLTN